MTDLESELDTLRTLDILRVRSAKLRTEGRDALVALLEQDTRVGSLLFCMDDITDTCSLIDKLRSDANPATRPVSTFVWAHMPQATRDLLDDSTLPLLERGSVLLQELNSILDGPSIYESARFTEVALRPETRSLS
jgi:hypothetical protein